MLNRSLTKFSTYSWFFKTTLNKIKIGREGGQANRKERVMGR